MGSKSLQYQLSPGSTAFLSISVRAQILGLRCDNGTFFVDVMQPDSTSDIITRQFYLTNGSWDNVPHESEKIKYCGSFLRTYSNCCSSCGHPTSGAGQPTMHHLIEIVSDSLVPHIDIAAAAAVADITKELEKAKALMQQQLDGALKTIKEHKEAFEKHIMAVIEARDL